MYYSAKTSRHRQNGLSYVPKKILTWMLREARRGLKGTEGNGVTTRLLLSQWIFQFVKGQVVYATRTSYPGPFRECERAVLSFFFESCR